MLITPPIASVPKETGTTPLYTSMRSAKFTGMLFRSNAVLAPSCGTPSMNTFTCLPLNPSSISCISEPTPPVSRSFMPGSLVRASPRFLAEFCNPLVSTATALKAERFTLPIELPVTTEPSRRVMDGFNLMSCFIVSPEDMVTLFSYVSKPMADTASVYSPVGTSSL